MQVTYKVSLIFLWKTYREVFLTYREVSSKRLKRKLIAMTDLASYSLARMVPLVLWEEHVLNQSCQLVVESVVY